MDGGSDNAGRVLVVLEYFVEVEVGEAVYEVVDSVVVIVVEVGVVVVVVDAVVVVEVIFSVVLKAVKAVDLVSS